MVSSVISSANESSTTLPKAEVIGVFKWMSLQFMWLEFWIVGQAMRRV
jgi:hypothetical protein